MSFIRPVLMTFAAILVTSVSAFAASDTQAVCPAPNAGLQILQFGTMNLAVWYPTSAPESPYTYNTNISGTVALNGPVSTCSHYPLVVFSHAYGGCGTQSVFLTEQMARYGYIIAAPDHADAGCSVTSSTGSSSTITMSPSTGPSFTDPSAWNNQTYINRYVDDENTINGMLVQPQLGPQIDPTRIAMSGHSLGGYDTFAMIGGWSNWLDPRLKVGLMLSPYIQPFQQPPSTVPIPHVPQMYQGGTLDFGITPWLMESGGQYDQAQTPKIFLELQGAGHLDFSNKVCNANGPTTVQICLATVPNAAFIDNYSFAFLGYYLNNQTQSLLWGQGTGLAAFWRNTPAAAVSSASFLPGAPVAPSEITALFGQGMANVSAGYTGLPLSTSLGGTVVTITDSLGTGRAAGLFYVSPQQINFEIPPGTAPGAATITVTVGGSVIASGQLTIAALAPSIFTIDQSGTGQVDAYLQSSAGYSFPYNPTTLAPVPVNVSSGGVFMVMAGTGAVSGYGSAATATIGSVNVPVTSVGPYPPYAGLDAIVLGPLPASLQGAGKQTISLSVNGVAANPVTVVIQ